MKKLLPLLLVIAFSNCSQKEPLKMQGAYSIKSQTVNYGAKDTVINRKQMKIFTDDHVIFAAMRLPDSLASYGIGTYDIKDGNVIEHFFYTSGNAARRDTFILKIDNSANGYKQLYDHVSSQNRKYSQVEEYEAIGKSDSTPLDGAWKQAKNYYILKSGDTSSNPNITEFKVYQSGHFIWAASYPDSTNKVLTFFGYGNFEMNGNNGSKEVNTLSTYPPIIDSTFNVQLEFMGKDSYKQTIVQRDSARSVEIYERLKRN